MTASEMEAALEAIRKAMVEVETTAEASILYQNGAHWVFRGPKQYEVLRDSDSGTHSVVLDRIGASLPDALDRAKRCCDAREEQRKHTR